MSDSNPFATRYTRPGAIDYLFDNGQSLESLVARLHGNAWWGEIIGPHGSGKSTLLAALVPALESAGRRVVRLMISPANGTGSGFGVQGSESSAGAVAWILPSEAYLTAAAQSLDSSLQLVVDGYEQLSWWTRRRIQSLCRRSAAGLLVTAHQSVGLTPLAVTTPSTELALRIVARLIPESDTKITPSDVRTAYDRSGGNLRETLFGLFDIYQSRRG